MNNPKLIILDLDDTLYSEKEFVLSGFRHISEKISFKIPQLQQSEIYEYLVNSFEISSKKVFDSLIDHFSIQRYFTVLDLVSSYKYHVPKIYPYYDVIQFLKKVKDKSIPVVLLTDGDVIQQSNKVSALKIEPYFNKIFYSDSYGIDKRKPNIFMYLEILSKFQISRSLVINIGDNPNKDFYVNKSLGIFSIQLRRQNAIYANKVPYFQNIKPNQVVTSLLDIRI